MKHDDALIDRLIDGDLSKSKAEEVREHLKECERCREQARSVRILTKALAANPTDALRDDERERLVEVVVGAAGRSQRRLPRAAWIGMAAIVVLIAAIALPVALRAGSNKPAPQGSAGVQSSEAQRSEPAQGAPATLAPNAPLPVVVSANHTYKDTAAIDQAYRENRQASSFVGYYKASDVGALQRPMQEYINEQAPKGTGRSPAECMNTVFRSVPRPLLPAYVERAKYEGVDSWVIVFAFAPDSAPDALLSENLIYVMSASDCGLAATASYR